jgi:hypothetical protein
MRRQSRLGSLCSDDEQSKTAALVGVGSSGELLVLLARDLP